MVLTNIVLIVRFVRDQIQSLPWSEFLIKIIVLGNFGKKTKVACDSFEKY